MKALTKASPRLGAELRTVPIPIPVKGELLVKVRAASICGSDLHIYKWNRWAQSRFGPLPLVFGHEFVGEVVGIGEDVAGFSEGQIVSAETHIVCGRCYQCRVGEAHVCQNTSILGVDRQGAFAEYVSIPAQNAWVTDPGMDASVACMQEPYGNAIHLALSVALPGRTVLVSGCGPIGLMTVAVARASGASQVFASEVSSYRCGLARTMGATRVFDPTREDVVRGVKEMTGGIGADVVLEASGSPQGLVEGLRSLRDGGTCALLGLPEDPVQIDVAHDVIFKGITIKGIVGRRLFEDWYLGKALLQSGAVDLRPLVTHQFALEDFEQAFAIGLSGQSGKIVFNLSS